MTDKNIAYRLNRRIRPAGFYVRKSRRDQRQYGFGNYYLVDVKASKILDCDVDLKGLHATVRGVTS